MAPAYKTYLKQVKRALCCSKAAQERLIAGLEQEVMEAFPDAGKASIDQIEAQFGAPEAMAQELQQALSDTTSTNTAKKHIHRMWWLFFLCLLAVILVAGCIIYVERAKAEQARLEAENTPPQIIVVEPTPEVIVVEPSYPAEIRGEPHEPVDKETG